MIGSHAFKQFGHNMAGAPMPPSPTMAAEAALVARTDIAEARQAARADRRQWSFDVLSGAMQLLYRGTVGLILSEGE